MSCQSATSSIMGPPNVASKQVLAHNPPQLLSTTAKLNGLNVMGVRFPVNGSPHTRCKINLMNIYDDAGIKRNWPDGGSNWNIDALRHVRALFVSWHDPILRLANGLYYVFGGNVHSGLPVNKYFEKNRYGLHGDVIILKPAGNRLPDNSRVEFINVPEELLYPRTIAGFVAKINDMP